MCDSDNSGTCTKDEVWTMAQGMGMTEADRPMVEGMFDMIDTDASGEVDVAEADAFFGSQGPPPSGGPPPALAERHHHHHLAEAKRHHHHLAERHHHH
jgi:hypothetical protein